MEDYINRKKKGDTNKTPVSTETQPQIIIRQSKNQLADLNVRLDLIEERSQLIRKRLATAFLEIDQLKQKNLKVLDLASSKQPSIETTLPNRQTSKTNGIIQQAKQLDIAERVDQQINNKSFKRLRSPTNDDKLSQTRLSTGKQRGFAKKQKMDG